MEIDIWNNQLNKEEANAAFQAVMDRCVSDGRIVKQLEEKIGRALGIPYVIAVPSGSMALLLSLIAIGVKPGDEVIVPDITFIATANAAKVLGAKVVVADTEENVPVIGEGSIMPLINEKTKAIIPVHINGHIACTQSLKKKLYGTGIFIIDDACQAFMSGSEGSYAGNYADIACYSMGISKMAASGQGGFVTTRNEGLYRRMKKIKTQGLESVCDRKDYKMLGFNFKMSDVLAAIGVVQLGKVNDKMAHMWDIYHLYYRELASVEGIRFIPRREDELPWMTYVLCEERDIALQKMKDKGIVGREIGECLHRASYLEARGVYPHSTKFEKQILVLPSGPDQPLENIRKVCEVLKGGR